MGIHTDTIAAISSPRGEGAIGLVRLSGPESFSIASRLFRRAHPSKTLFTESHRIHYGHIVDPTAQQVVDEVLLTVLKSPHTYTREDMIEINCHGGPLVLEQVLLLTLRHGARLAEPGEFTKRAFLNGRIDLAQAEAVAEVIQAQTELSLRAALDHLRGGLSRAVDSIRNQVIQILAELEAAIDFPDEDLDFESPSSLTKQLRHCLETIEQLIRTAKEGRIVREGVRTAIVGRPNVGKSSLLNALLQTDRAIVTEIPGTTRDTIEESLNIRGLLLRMVDTAGFREARDRIEALGIERSRRAMESADLVLLVLDLSEPIQPEDRVLIREVRHRKTLFIANKCDKPHAWDADGFEFHVTKTSTLDGTGLEALKEAIWQEVLGGASFDESSPLVTSVRHQRALEEAYRSLRQALETLEAHLSYEFVALDLREALDRLGSIVGQTTTEDILDRIFAQFCIGK